jgi:hypothetical protein
LPADSASSGVDEVVASLQTQVDWCLKLDAPFTAGLVGAVRDDVARGGALADLVVPWPGKPFADALPIRLAGAFHALARSGRVPDLSVIYPPALPPNWQDPAMATLVGDVARAHRDAIAAFIAHPPQTNEVARSAVLMAGYAEVARTTRLPLRILELGASAGLNLLWDHWAYRIGPRTIGPADAALTLAPEWRGTPPAIEQLPAVAERRGCDRSPIDLDAPGAVDRLLAYVWPDHRERMERLAAAIAVARAARPTVDAADAGDWLEDLLLRAPTAAPVATVVAHSIVWQYFAPSTKERARSALERAGAAATPTHPLAWLAFEQRTTDTPPEVTLRVWPGGDRKTIARAHPHGAWIEWLAET